MRGTKSEFGTTQSEFARLFTQIRRGIQPSIRIGQFIDVADKTARARAFILKKCEGSPQARAPRCDKREPGCYLVALIDAAAKNISSIVAGRQGAGLEL